MILSTATLETVAEQLVELQGIVFACAAALVVCSAFNHLASR